MTTSSAIIRVCPISCHSAARWFFPLPPLPLVPGWEPTGYLIRRSAMTRYLQLLNIPPHRQATHKQLKSPSHFPWGSYMGSSGPSRTRQNFTENSTLNKELVFIVKKKFAAGGRQVHFRNRIACKYFSRNPKPGVLNEEIFGCH